MRELYRFEIYRHQDPFFSELLATWERFGDTLAQAIETTKRAAASEFGTPVFLKITLAECQLCYGKAKSFDSIIHEGDCPSIPSNKSKEQSQ